MEMSHLRVKVDSEGIAETSKKLGGLGNSAGNAEAKVVKLTDSIGKLINANGKLATSQTTASAAAAQQMQSLASMQGVLNQIVHALGQVANGYAAVNGHLANFNNSTQQTVMALQRKSQWGNVWTSTLKAMITATSTYLSLNFAKSVVQQADAWVMMQARLRIATGTMESAKAAQAELFDISQKLRVPLDDMTRLYQRMIVPLEKIGKTAEESRRHIEFIGLGLQLSGATAAEAASTMLQYSQAINSGRLNGAEFNAVSEASPIILRKIEEYLLATDAAFVRSGGNLKKWASEGKVTVDVLQAAAEAALPELQRQAAELPLTVDGMLTRIRNAWLKAVGEIGQNSQLGSKFVEALETLERNLPRIATVMVQALAWVAENFKLLIGLATTLAAIGIVKWATSAAQGLLSLATAANAAAAAQAAMAAGISAAGAAAGVARVALAALGGPIGIAIGLITAGISAWMMWGDEAEKNSQRSAEATRKETVDIINDLQRQIEKYEERNKVRAMNIDPDSQTSTEQRRLKELEAQINDAKNRSGSFADTPEDQRVANLQALLIEYSKLNAVVEKYNQLVAEDKKRANKTRLDSTMSQFETEFGSKQDKAQDAIETWKKKIEDLGGTWTTEMEKMIRDKYKLDAASESASTRLTKSLRQELETMQKRTATEQLQMEQIGKSFEEQSRLAAEKLRREAEELDLMSKKKGLTEEQVRLYKQLADEKRKQAGIEVMAGLARTDKKDDKAEFAAAKQALEDLNNYLKKDKIDSFAKSLSDAFGNVGKAIGKAGDALLVFQKREAAAAKARKDADKSLNAGLISREEHVERLAEIERRQGQAQIDVIADVLSATKTLFKEHTAGYKVMHAAEQAFRAFQYAEALKNGLLELGLIEKTTVARLAGYVETAMAAVKSTAIQIANAMGLGTVLAAVGVANQAQGDPYSAWGRMAAMAAVMAGLGFAVSASRSGGGAERVTNTGTGTTFGDSSAESESIADSLEILEDVDTMTMRYSAEMAASLRSIESNIGGLTNLLIRSGSLEVPENTKTTTTLGRFMQLGDNLTAALLNPLDKLLGIDLLGSALSSVTGKLFNKKVDIKGHGLFGADQNLGRIMQNGFDAYYYTDIETRRRAFGVTYDRNRRTDYTEADQELERQFQLIFTNFADVIRAAAGPLDRSLSDVETRLSNFVVSIGHINLQGLSGEQIQERLAAVLGAAGDNIAKAVLPGLEDFQQVGEGYLETVVRVANGVEAARYELDLLGVAAVNFKDLMNTQGDVGAEIVRASLLLKEGSSGVADIIRTLEGTASEIADIYRALTSVRNMLRETNIADDLTADMIRAAGGIENLSSSLNDYFENFFSDAERQAAQARMLRQQFQALGVAMPTTKEGFRALIEQISAMGNSELAVKLLGLSGAFADLIESMDGSEAVTEAREALVEAYEREADALETTRSKFEDFAKSLRQFRENLLTGELSPLSNQQKYATLKNQFETTATRAMTGDEDALAEFESIAQTFLQFSREYNASGVQYNTDFQRVLELTTQLEAFSMGRATVAEQQLEALKDQVDGLIQIDESVKSVVEAIVDLQEALTAQQGVLTPTLSPTTGLEVDPTDPRAKGPGYIKYGQELSPTTGLQPLVATVEELKTEMQALRAEQAEQTAALITAQMQASEQNAQTVVEGTQSAYQSGQWWEKTRQGLTVLQ